MIVGESCQYPGLSFVCCGAEAVTQRHSPGNFERLNVCQRHAEFVDRLRASVERHQPLLDRLKAEGD